VSMAWQREMAQKSVESLTKVSLEYKISFMAFAGAERVVDLRFVAVCV
jgi:hypothetical protein